MIKFRKELKFTYGHIDYGRTPCSTTYADRNATLLQIRVMPRFANCTIEGSRMCYEGATGYDEVCIEFYGTATAPGRLHQLLALREVARRQALQKRGGIRFVQETWDYASARMPSGAPDWPGFLDAIVREFSDDADEVWDLSEAGFNGLVRASQPWRGLPWSKVFEEFARSFILAEMAKVELMAREAA